MNIAESGWRNVGNANVQHNPVACPVPRLTKPWRGLRELPGTRRRRRPMGPEDAACCRWMQRMAVEDARRHTLGITTKVAEWRGDFQPSVPGQGRGVQYVRGSRSNFNALIRDKWVSIWQQFLALQLETISACLNPITGGPSTPPRLCRTTPFSSLRLTWLVADTVTFHMR